MRRIWLRVVPQQITGDGIVGKLLHNVEGALVVLGCLAVQATQRKADDIALVHRCTPLTTRINRCNMLTSALACRGAGTLAQSRRAVLFCHQFSSARPFVVTPMLRFRPAPARPHAPARPAPAVLQRRLTPRAHFTEQTSPQPPAAPRTPPTVSAGGTKGAGAPNAKAAPATPSAAAGAASKLSAQEQLKEFEAVMMQYLQTTAKPLGGSGGDKGGGGKQKAGASALDDDGSEALLDAATEALIKKKEEEFRKINFWDAFMAPQVRTDCGSRILCPAEDRLDGSCGGVCVFCVCVFVCCTHDLTGT